jgi:hypothetical protein
VELHCDDPRPRMNEWSGQRTGARADVEHEITGADMGLLNESASGVISELMPAPAWWPCRGHDAP